MSSKCAAAGLIAGLMALVVGGNPSPVLADSFGVSFGYDSAPAGCYLPTRMVEPIYAPVRVIGVGGYYYDPGYYDPGYYDPYPVLMAPPPVVVMRRAPLVMTSPRMVVGGSYGWCSSPRVVRHTEYRHREAHVRQVYVPTGRTFHGGFVSERGHYAYSRPAMSRVSSIRAGSKHYRGHR